VNAAIALEIQDERQEDTQEGLQNPIDETIRNAHIVFNKDTQEGL